MNWLLALLAVLAPHTPRVRLLPTAEVIVAVTKDSAEAALLAVVDHDEPEFGTCIGDCAVRRPPQVEHATIALDALRVGAALCGARWTLHFFRTGECPCLRPRCPRELRPDRQSEKQYRRWRFLVGLARGARRP